MSTLRTIRQKERILFKTGVSLNCLIQLNEVPLSTLTD